MGHPTMAKDTPVFVGTGGIGTGVFFALDGSETLGREESRSGRFLRQRDYCKLHIVAYGVGKLSGVGSKVYPIGVVGNDPDGQRLIEEMAEASLQLDYVKIAEDAPTLRAISLVYPDGSGGNLTTRESASHNLDAKHVRSAEPVFKANRGTGFAAALPEVPLLSRQALLTLARENDFFTAASFLSSEMPFVRESMILNDVDLLAINCDEAACLAMVSRTLPPGETVEALVRMSAEKFPHLRLSITAGRQGSWTWDEGTVHHIAPCAVEVRNGAGAGDTHLAGLLAGLGSGLNFSGAHEVAALAGAFSVTSEHAIHPALSRKKLFALAKEAGQTLSEPVLHFLDSENFP